MIKKAHLGIVLALLTTSLFTACGDPQFVMPPNEPEDFEEVAIEKNLTFLTPEDFTDEFGEQIPGLVLNFKDVKPEETISVIAVHGSQLDTYPQEMAFNFKISQEGLSDLQHTQQAMQSPAEEHNLETNISKKVESDIFILDHVMKAMQAKPDMGTILRDHFDKTKKPQAPSFGKCLGPYTVGTTTCEFQVLINDYDQETSTAVLRYESQRALFFVDFEDLDPTLPADEQITDQDLQEMALVLDTKTFPGLEKYYGQVPDVDGNGKFIVLLSSRVKKIKANGYVAPWDLAPKTVYSTSFASNEADMIYMNTPHGTNSWGYTKEMYMTKVVHQTIAHETKHLISSYARLQKWATSDDVKTLEKPWLEESSAMAAPELCGSGMPIYTQAKTFAGPALANPQDFHIVYEYYPVDSDGLRAMYGFNFILLWRVAEQMGHEHFWKSLVNGSEVGVKNLLAASSGVFQNFAQILQDFGLTLLFDGTNPSLRELQKYQFQAPQMNLRDGSWTPLGIASIPAEPEETYEHTASSQLKNTGVESFAFFQAKGTDQDARVILRINSENSQPYFTVVRH